ncbi:VPS10 domain-containing receptor SorCS1 [Bagarius yarrelli]|uniref:VPS10 domain-containing receptor SorCS1 n=1 Tax=Bagarius yarrelli TaxID=175774 RepID=A0A556TKL6_BAGYA|nr:VPS10 domain-containing receptor SorCS1 [Bagarius yarrelli]
MPAAVSARPAASSLACTAFFWTFKVILMLTKLYDFNLGSVTESSLWRSTDYGTTYEKLNEKVGVKTILSYLYVSPNNKQKIMLLTDPEVENSLLISTDEGATYQKYRLGFYVLSLLFHPEQEDWILAYSHDQKLYSSVEFGRRWQLVHERVAPNRFYWSKTGLDKEPGLIHLETTISETQALYITCKLQNCTETNKGKPFPGYIDPNSLVVQDEYVFVQVSTSGRPIYYVSSRRDLFTPMKLPKYTLPKIFDEEYSILYLDQGGALVAIQHTPLPIRHLWLSFDEGRVWSKYSFTSSPLFVDGVLGEPGEETLIMTIFGHVSHRSEWQLVKIDFRSIFNRRCIEADYQTWHLHNQGEPCLMGVKRIYRKLKPMAKCVMGKTHSVTLTSDPCECTESDFECDYGYERRTDGRCTPAFWFHPSSMSRSCITGHTFLNSTGYRKVVSNNCTSGVVDLYMARRRPCPSQAPKGLHLVTSEGKFTATLGHNVTFLIFLEQGDGSRTSITLDFGDGHAITYSNVSSIEDGIKHIYKSVGIYRVTATAENTLGFETAVLFLHVTCQLEYIHLSAPFVAVKNKEVNLTVVLWPSQVGTVTYIWWFGNNSEPIITLEGSVAFTFPREGINVVTVQVVAGSTIQQDRKTIAVHDYFQSHLLAFSSNLDEHNPEVAEWRLDISRVIKNSMVHVTGVNPEHLLVTVLPGLPTAAEFFLLPDKELTEGKADKAVTHLDQLSELVLNALNQNQVQFTLRPGVQITVYAAHLSAAPLVDMSENHSGSAMLMLLTVVVVGLAVFLIYKFKRKIPGLHLYAAMQNEKEQEMIRSPTSPMESEPSISSQRELPTSLESPDTELNVNTIECIKPQPRVRISTEPPVYIDV